MSILEQNCEWHFEKQPQAAQDIGPNNAAEAYFADTPYPSLIREFILEDKVTFLLMQMNNK